MADLKRRPNGRFRNYVLAVLAATMMIVLPFASAIVVLSVVLSAAMAVGGVAAKTAVYNVMAQNPNLYSILVYVLSAIPVYLWVIKMRAHRRGRIISFNVANLPKHTWRDIACMGVGLNFLTTTIMVLVIVLLPRVYEQYEILLEGSGVTSYSILWVIATLILPPMVEEAGFRGLTLTYFRRAGLPFWLANVLQALAFGVFHGNLTQGLYTFSVGLGLGYIVHHTGSLVPAMVAHLIYNVMGTLGTDIIAAAVPNFMPSVSTGVGFALVWCAVWSLAHNGYRDDVAGAGDDVRAICTPGATSERTQATAIQPLTMESTVKHSKSVDNGSTQGVAEQGASSEAAPHDGQTE